MAKKSKKENTPIQPPEQEKVEKESDEVQATGKKIDEEAVVKCINEWKTDSYEYYKQKFQKFNYFDRLYIRGAAKTNVPWGRANLELPLAFQQIEPFVSQLLETLAGETPYIAFEGRTPDADDAARLITEYVSWQIDKAGFVPQFTSFLRNLAKYGTAIMKVAWEVDADEITEEEEVPSVQINPLTLQPEVIMTTQVVTKPLVKHDGPMVYNLPIFDIFVPRSATSPNIQKMEYVIHRSYRTPEELLKNENYTYNRDKLKKMLGEESKGNSPRPETSKEISLAQNGDKAAKKYEGKLEVLEVWCNWNFDKYYINKKEGDDSEDSYSEPALIVIVNSNVEEHGSFLIRYDDNPLKFKFKPFIMANDYTIEGEPYGYGELDHIKGLIEESTALRNARLDVANLSLNRTWIVEKTAGINIRDIYSAPNHIILTNDKDGIRALDMKEVTPSSVQELAKIDFDIQNTTEIINPRQDVNSIGSGFGQTATGVNFLSGKTNLRMLTKARILEEQVFEQLALMFLWYDKDFITSDTYFRAGGESNPLLNIGPDVLASEVDYKSISNPQKLSMSQRRDNISYLLQVIAQVEKVAPGTNDLQEILKEVYRISGFSHPEKYVKPPVTTVLQTPQGLVDNKGQPVNVVPVDETGQPIDPNSQPG